MLSVKTETDLNELNGSADVRLIHQPDRTADRPTLTHEKTIGHRLCERDFENE